MSRRKRTETISCPSCGSANAADRSRCAECDAALDEARETAAAAGEPPEASGPRCPNCGARMERGTATLGQRMIDLVFSALSAQSLYFHPREGRRREVLKAGVKRRALLCPICGGMWMR
ncbi:MAG TPA: hypothetical protein VEW03_03365 [Longimicrobiaceae bacterium]|nr:hypothetical protein [Longimicrobiaceae bacterium]